MKRRRGLSTIVGIVFFIIVFTGVASYVTYSMNHLNRFGETIIEKSQEDRNRDREEFEITKISRDSNKFNITVQNTGELPINITRLWIQNKTDPSWGTSKFDVNKNVVPGQTLTRVGQDLQLTALDTQGYGIRLVTERGNAREFLVNSVSQEPVYLQLFALPVDLPTGYTTTLLFAVTNNMSNNGVLTNFQPNLVVTVPVGASVTPLSGPEPTAYSLLEKGDTAYFQWTYRITGSNGQQVKFETSLQNGYLANSVSKNVTINVAGTATKDSSGYHRSQLWYSSDTYSHAGGTLTQTVSANVTRAQPFIIGTGFTADRIQFEVTGTVVASKCSVAIYDDNGSLYPNNLIVASTDIDTSTTGLKTTTINTVLNHNTLYWLAYNCQKAVTLRAIPQTSMPGILGFTGVGTNGDTQNQLWSVSGTHPFAGFTMPNPYPVGGTLITDVNGILIQVRMQ